MSKNDESLQASPIPKVLFPSIAFQNYEKIIITTQLMNPLFPEKLIESKNLGKIETQLTLTEDQNAVNEDGHSWNFNENFPNEFDPDNEDRENQQQAFNFEFPVFAVGKVVIISIQDNFLKISPIFSNIISKKLIEQLPRTIKPLILGSSDRIASVKEINDHTCTLVPPEFITGFIASLLTELTIHNETLQNGENKFQFDAILVPSEGPLGFEKLNLTVIQDLIDLFKEEWPNLDPKVYAEESYRNWKLAGSVLGAQSGLYI